MCCFVHIGVTAMGQDGSRFEAYTILIASGALGALGDVLMNHWAKSGKTLSLVASLFLWVVAVSAFAWLLKAGRFPFGGAVVLGLLVHSTTALIFDRLYFGGRLSIWQWGGIALAVLAMVLIDLGHASTDRQRVDAKANAVMEEVR